MYSGMYSSFFMKSTRKQLLWNSSSISTPDYQDFSRPKVCILTKTIPSLKKI